MGVSDRPACGEGNAVVTPVDSGKGVTGRRAGVVSLLVIPLGADDGPARGCRQFSNDTGGGE